MDTTNVTVSKLPPSVVKQSSSGCSSMMSQPLSESNKTEGIFHAYEFACLYKWVTIYRVEHNHILKLHTARFIGI